MPGRHFHYEHIKGLPALPEDQQAAAADSALVPFNVDPKAMPTGPSEPTNPTLVQRRAELFFVFYFFMTGLHALHMIIGLAVVGVLVWMAWRGAFGPRYHTPLELTGLYWHFVDIVWVFLYPTLYLIHLHK